MRGCSCAVVLGCKAEPSRAGLMRRPTAQALGEVRQQVRGEVVAVEEGRARAEAAAAAARADARASRDELAALKVCPRPDHPGPLPATELHAPFRPLPATVMHAPFRPLPAAEQYAPFRPLPATELHARTPARPHASAAW